MKFKINAMGSVGERTQLFRAELEKLPLCDEPDLAKPCQMCPEETLLPAFEAALEYGFGAMDKLARLGKSKRKYRVEEAVYLRFCCIHQKEKQYQAGYEQMLEEMKAESGIPDHMEGPLVADRVPEFYYGRKDGRFWYLTADGVYTPVSYDVAKKMLADAGIATEVEDNGQPSAADRRLLEAIEKRGVDMVTPLGGYQAGYYRVNDCDILVTRGYQLIQPKPGICKNMKAIFRGLLVKSERDNGEVTTAATEPYWCLLKHLQNSYNELAAGHRAGSLAVFLCGVPDAGKSLLLEIMAKILGGRVGNAYLYISGQTSFNDELIGKENWFIDDGVPLSDYAARARLAGLLKQAVAANSIPCHGKGKAQGTLPVYRRPFIALNPEDMETLPPLKESVGDKYMLLRAHKFDMPADCLPLPDREHRKAFMAKIESEIPAFLHWLLAKDLSVYADRRLGVRAVKDVGFMIANAETMGLDAKYEILKSVLFRGNKVAADAVSMYSGQIFEKLTDSVFGTKAMNLFRDPRSLGIALSELESSATHKHLVQSRVLDGKTLWTVIKDKVPENKPVSESGESGVEAGYTPLLPEH